MIAIILADPDAWSDPNGFPTFIALHFKDLILVMARVRIGPRVSYCNGRALSTPLANLPPS